MSNEAQGKELPPTIPFPVASGVPPSESFVIEIPPSGEPRFLACQFYRPGIAVLAMPAQDQSQVQLPTGSTLLFALRPMPQSSLAAGGA